MTNQPLQDTNKVPPQAPAKASGESLISKIGGGFSWWIGSLTGKPQSRKNPIAAPVAQTVSPTSAGSADTVSAQTQTAGAPSSPVKDGKKSEDSVLQDVQALKNLVGKFSGGVTSKVGPALKQGMGGTAKAADTFSKRVGPGFMTKVLRIFFILVFVIVVIFVARKLLTSSGENGGNAEATPELTGRVTPTQAIYNPPKASIYATDESILKLEEDINVITREVGSVVLRETELVPPTLDFNVNLR